MAGLVKKFLASASVVAGMSAVFSAPAVAAPEIQNVYLYGQSLIYGDDSGYNLLFTDNDGTAGDLDLVWDNSGNLNLGNSGKYILQNPNHGNIELSGHTGDSNASSMDTSTYLQVLFDDASDITFRSMTEYDWLGADGELNEGDFFYQWFNQGIATQGSGLEAFGYSPEMRQKGVEFFTEANSLNGNTPQINRLSDPNIATVQKQNNGDIFFQLAGHKDHSSGFNFSEVVAVQSGSDFLGYFYSFGDPDELATVFDNDSEGSHEGLYNFTITSTSGGGVLSEDVPEPSTVLGLMAIGGLVAATKRKSQK